MEINGKKISGEAPLGSITFAAFDLETTGMDPVQDRIIEIGIKIFRKNEVLKTYHQMINPGISIPREAFLVHGINDEELKDKPSLSQILPDVFSLLGDTIPVAHNAPFDVAFLLEAASQNAVSFPASLVVDSCLLARKTFPDFDNHKLAYLTEKFGFQSDKPHRALNDAHCCFALFCRIVEELPLKWDTTWGDFHEKTQGVFSMDLQSVPLPEKFLPLADTFHRRETVILSYRDGKGQITRREVTPMGFLSDGKKMVLMGYCYMRRGTRTFRLDRILEIEKGRSKPE